MYSLGRSSLGRYIIRRFIHVFPPAANMRISCVFNNNDNTNSLKHESRFDIGICVRTKHSIASADV